MDLSPKEDGDCKLTEWRDRWSGNEKFSFVLALVFGTDIL
jgi:hypothetical protein